MAVYRDSATGISPEDDGLYLPTTLESFLHLHPAVPSTPMEEGKRPSQIPGLAERDAVWLAGMPTDVPSLLSMIEPMTPTLDENESAVFINMLDRPVEDIWADFVQVTGAQVVSPDPKDLQMLEELEVQNRRTKIDRENTLAWKAEIKKDQDMLKAAKETS
jgi:hypothetical protein